MVRFMGLLLCVACWAAAANAQSLEEWEEWGAYGDFPAPAASEDSGGDIAVESSPTSDGGGAVSVDNVVGISPLSTARDVFASAGRVLATLVLVAIALYLVSFVVRALRRALFAADTSPSRRMWSPYDVPEREYDEAMDRADFEAWLSRNDNHA